MRLKTIRFPIPLPRAAHGSVFVAKSASVRVPQMLATSTDAADENLRFSLCTIIGAVGFCWLAVFAEMEGAHFSGPDLSFRALLERMYHGAFAG